MVEAAAGSRALYWGNIGLMENKMEATMVYWGLYGDDGKENGSYYMYCCCPLQLDVFLKNGEIVRDDVGEFMNLGFGVQDVYDSWKTCRGK